MESKRNEIKKGENNNNSFNLGKKSQIEISNNNQITY